MTDVELSLEQKLKQYDYEKMQKNAVDSAEKFMEKLEEKEYEELEVGEEQYTIDNLLDIISRLNEKVESLTEDYNDLIVDCSTLLEDIVYSIPDFEEL